MVMLRNSALTTLASRVSGVGPVFVEAEKKPRNRPAIETGRSAALNSGSSVRRNAATALCANPRERRTSTSVFNSLDSPVKPPIIPFRSTTCGLRVSRTTTDFAV